MLLGEAGAKAKGEHRVGHRGPLILSRHRAAWVTVFRSMGRVLAGAKLQEASLLSPSPANHRFTTVLGAAQLCYLVMILLLVWMKDPLTIGGLDAYPADYLFVAAAVLWLVALVRGETSVRWHRGYWIIALYFAAMSLSALHSSFPQRSAFKLLTQVYLLALPILTFNLIRTLPDFIRLVRWWMTATAGVAFLGVATLLLFPFFGANSALSWPLHHFGTLPPGAYPRLELTFSFPAMLANYLTVSVALLLIAVRLGWLNSSIGVVLGAGILLSALFALTPGFGGLLFVLGAWFWYRKHDESPLLARVALIAAGAMPIVGVLLASATPILHRTAPFLIHIAGLPVPLAPSVRLLAWIEATQNFFASPIIGRGIGIDAVRVVYEQANLCSGICVTDAHYTFLNFAVQTGSVGLGALLLTIGFVACHIPRPPSRSETDAIVFGLAIAWLSGFALQGLVGSFEDARHLWILFGLILSASALPRSKLEVPTSDRSA